jgi:hypothetical protein
VGREYGLSVLDTPHRPIQGALLRKWERKQVPRNPGYELWVAGMNCRGAVPTVWSDKLPQELRQLIEAGNAGVLTNEIDVAVEARRGF